MRITIDNGDGRGAVDYSEAVTAEGPVTVQRMLNAPSRCTAEIICGLNGLAVPVRLGRVVVTSAAGVVLFTGYLASEPVMVCAGEGTTGVVFTARLSAISDEWLLDRAGSGVSAGDGLVLQTDAASAVEQLAGRVLDGAAALTLESSGVTRALGAVAFKASEPWSVNAGVAAGAGYASYRANGGTVLTIPAAGTAHAFSSADGSLDIRELDISSARELANDVTLSGAEEPAAYVSESFVGDGTTTLFELSETPFRATASTDRELIRDGFAGAAIDSATWQVSDPSSALSLTSAGLTVSGGTGVDGQTFVRGLDLIELGGSLVAQLSGVVIGSGSGTGSAGVLSGFFAGTPTPANCVAGFRVRQNSGVTVLVPLVNGAEVGTVFTPTSGHMYTLRVRVHCVEMLRVGQPYYCLVDGAVQSFGSAAGIEAPVDLVFEVVDEGSASNTPATVLYDSTVTGTVLTGVAGACSFAVVSAATMTASVGAVSVTRPGSLWVVSTLPDGTKATRLVGTAGQGVDCAATYGSSAGTPGKITFFSGRVPVANERVTVMYRMSQRSVARLADAASIAAEAAGGMGGVSRWIGKVLQPPARSSVDCESAAQALLAFATSRSAALKGTYAVVNPAADMWPGDLLQITSDGATTPLLVRSVTVADGHAVPEVLAYKITFANDWATELADGLGLKLSDEIASDAVLPATAANGPGGVLANLQQLALTSLSGTMLTIDAGIDPPSGGGFEIRRRDWLFGAGADPADLMVRSPVRSFTLTRAAQVERFYVRMYDASGKYSRFSSAVIVQAAVG